MFQIPCQYKIYIFSTDKKFTVKKIFPARAHAFSKIKGAEPYLFFISPYFAKRNTKEGRREDRTNRTFLKCLFHVEMLLPHPTFSSLTVSVLRLTRKDTC